MNVSNIAFPSPIQIRDICETVFANQERLNTQAYDQVWKEKAATGEFDYRLAAGFEIIELGNSWNRWNWWAKSTPDEFAVLNMKVEAVDALHFIASDAILAYKGDTQALQIDMSEALAWVQRTLPILHEKDEVPYIKGLIKALLRYAGSEVPGSKEHSRDALCNLYRLTIHACGIGLRELSTMYFAKSTLNQFRQDNGYREKKYTKVWKKHPTYGNVEDNHMMMNWISAQDPLPKPPEVYAWLTEQYAKITQPT